MFEMSEKLPQEKAAMAYCRRRSNSTLLGVLDSTDLRGDVDCVRDLLRSCGKLIRGKRIRCGLYGCALCGPRFRRDAKRIMLKRLAARFLGLPRAEDCTFFSINGPYASPEEAQAVGRNFHRRLSYARKELLPDTSWLGMLDIDLMGKVHFHGLIVHKGLSKAEVIKILEWWFPEQDQVLASEWLTENSHTQNLINVLDYSLRAERHTKVVNGKLDKGPESAELIAKRIVAIQNMARRGTVGLRVAFNMKVESAWKWKNGLGFNTATGAMIYEKELAEFLITKVTTRKAKWSGQRVRGKNPKKESGEVHRRVGVGRTVVTEGLDAVPSGLLSTTAPTTRSARGTSPSIPRHSPSETRVSLRGR